MFGIEQIESVGLDGNLIGKAGRFRTVQRIELSGNARKQRMQFFCFQSKASEGGTLKVGKLACRFEVNSELRLFWDFNKRLLLPAFYDGVKKCVNLAAYRLEIFEIV